MPTAKPKIQIGDQVRPMDDAEFEQYQADQVDAANQTFISEQRAVLKLQTLAKLGLTADEISALLS